MKVQLCETVSVDVETMVEVDVNEVLNEFARQFESAEMNMDMPVRSQYLPMLDFATRLMARVPAAAIAKCKDSQRAEVVKRLLAEAERWNAVMVSAE